MIRFSTVVASFALVAGMAVSAPAFALPAQQTGQQVDLHDLDLSTRAGQDVARDRLAFAAEQSCARVLGEDADSDDLLTCRRQAFVEARGRLEEVTVRQSMERNTLFAAIAPHVAAHS